MESPSTYTLHISLQINHILSQELYKIHQSSNKKKHLGVSQTSEMSMKNLNTVVIMFVWRSGIRGIRETWVEVSDRVDKSYYVKTRSKISTVNGDKPCTSEVST